MAAPKNPRGGRKPRIPGEKATRKITVRLTVTEDDAFAAHVRALGKMRLPYKGGDPEPAVGAWLRDLGLAEIERVKTKP